jgi:hypothetical protein
LATFEPGGASPGHNGDEATPDSAEPPDSCWATPAHHPTIAGTPPANGTIDRRVAHCLDDAYVRVDTQTLPVDEALVCAGAREGGQVPYQAGLLFRDDSHGHS